MECDWLEKTPASRGQRWGRGRGGALASRLHAGSAQRLSAGGDLLRKRQGALGSSWPGPLGRRGPRACIKTPGRGVEARGRARDSPPRRTRLAATCRWGAGTDLASTGHGRQVTGDRWSGWWVMCGSGRGAKREEGSRTVLGGAGDGRPPLSAGWAFPGYPVRRSVTVEGKVSHFADPPTPAAPAPAWARSPLEAVVFPNRSRVATVVRFTPGFQRPPTHRWPLSRGGVLARCERAAPTGR